MKLTKLTLSSLDKNKYPDLEIECKVINDIGAYARQLIDNGATVHYAQKTSSVKARVGNLGEEVDTRPRVRRQDKVYVIGETKGKVKVEGSVIVTNPDGEEYIIKPDKFANKYSATDEKGVFKPIASPIKYIVVDDDITFTAPWGEKMYCTKGGVLNVSNLDDIYAIQNEPFSKTYSEVEKDQEL